MTRISAKRISMEGGRVDQAILKDYGEYMGATGGNGGTNPIVNIKNGNVYSFVLDQPNATFIFVNAGQVGILTTFTLILQQDGTGSRTAAWPDSVVWPGGTAPTLTATPNHFDTFMFATTSGGNSWLGLISAQDYA